MFHQAYLAAQRRDPANPLFPKVRCFPGGAAPKPPGLHADMKKELGGAGVVAGWGLTEAPILAMTGPHNGDDALAAKGVIIRKGETISAQEIEDLLGAHPAVADVAVIGLPDGDTGERACAVIVPADPTCP